MLQFYFDPTAQADQASFTIDAMAVAREVANRTNSAAGLESLIKTIQSEVRRASHRVQRQL